MRCKKIRDRIERYIDKSLPGKEQDEIQSHIKSCFDCTTFYQRAIDARENFAIDVPPVPGDFVIRTMFELRNLEIRNTDGKVDIFRMRWWHSSPIQIRIASVCFLLASFSLGIIIGRDITTSPENVSPYAENPYMDAFSENPQGSLENAFLQVNSELINGGNQ